MRDFRWLHFSDLHLTPEHPNFQTKMAWDALLDCLKKEDFGKRSDLYVFITGDIFNKGMFGQEDTKAAQIKEFLDKLGVRKERVFWAAGNHDMKRRTGGLLIENLRKKKYTLDELREHDKEEDENGYTPFQLLTRQRMHFYAKYYSLFFDRKLTRKDLDRIHQTYLLDDFNLVVLNTSFTSFDNNDAGNIFLCSSELFDAFRNLDKRKPVFVIGHHGKDFWEHNERRRVAPLFEKHADIYLCGHEHEPGIDQVNVSGREIRQLTCGGGVFDGFSTFNFFYGTYDSSDYAVEIVPYVYQRTDEWKRSFTGISRDFKEDTRFYFKRLIDMNKNRAIADGTESEEKTGAEKAYEEAEEGNGRLSPWNINRMAWRIPCDWDSDVKGAVPIDDKYVVPLPAQLIADRGRYVLFLAGDRAKGLLDAISNEEEKYHSRIPVNREKWKKRIWRKYSGGEMEENASAEEISGLMVSQKAEDLSLQEMRKALTKWKEEDRSTALLFHIWADNPFDAAVCAQRAAHILKEVFPIPVLLVADMEVVNGNETIVVEMDKKIDIYNQEGFSREKEIEDMLKYRDSHPDRWLLFLKRHASLRKGEGCIRGFEASYKVHEHAQTWVQAANLDLLLYGGVLSPFLLRLSAEKIDDLAWELFLLQMHSPTAARKKLLNKLRGQISESMRKLLKVWEHRDFSNLLEQLDYSEIAKWARQAGKEDYAYAFSALENDGDRRWVLMMSNVYSMDYIMDMLTDPVRKREAQMILNQAPEPTEDVTLGNETSYIRYLVHNEKI